MATESETAHRDDIILPLLLLGISAGATEGGVVAVSVIRLGGGIGSVIVGFVEGAATILAALIMPCLALGWLAGTSSARRLGKGLRAGLGGGEPGSPGLAMVIGIGMLVLSIFASVRTGALLQKSITDRFAVIGQALTLATVLALLVLTAERPARKRRFGVSQPPGYLQESMVDRFGSWRRRTPVGRIGGGGSGTNPPR